MNYKRIFWSLVFGFVLLFSIPNIVNKEAVQKSFIIVPPSGIFNRTIADRNQSIKLADYSSCTAQTFRDYNTFRQTITDLFTVISENRLSANYRLNYLKIAVEFFAQLKEKKTFQQIGAIVDLERSQKLSKMSIENIEDILKVLGQLFRGVKTKFEKNFGDCINKCYQDLDSAKKRIFADLYDIQRGAVCKRSKKYIYGFRDFYVSPRLGSRFCEMTYRR